MTLFSMAMLVCAFLSLIIIRHYQSVLVEFSKDSGPRIALFLRRRLNSCAPGSIGAECIPCPPGTFQAGHNTCEPCPSGFYQEDAGQAFCFECKSINYSGSGSNAAISVEGALLPLCDLFAQITPLPSLSPSLLPTNAPSKLVPTTAPPSMQPSPVMMTMLDLSFMPSQFQSDTTLPTDGSSPGFEPNHAPSFMPPSLTLPTTANTAPLMPPSTVMMTAFEWSMSPSNCQTVSPSVTVSSTPSSNALSSRQSVAPSEAATAEGLMPPLSPSLLVTLIGNTNSNVSLAGSELSQVCSANTTVMLHGDCVDCPSSGFYSFVLVYACLAVVLFIIFLFAPAYLWTCLDYLQTMGLLSLVRNIEWPFLVRHVLRHMHYWAAFDWLGIFPCIANGNLQAGRFLLVALPFLSATVPPDLIQLINYVGQCFNTYEKAQKWIDRYSAQFGTLLLLLTLQSVAVTVGEASILCEGVDAGMFCAGSTWSDKLLATVTFCFGIAHLVSLCFHLWRSRDESWSIVQRAFTSYWWWPIEFMVRKLAMVVVTFLWDGSTAVILLVTIEVGSILWYGIFSPYGDDNRPTSKSRRFVSAILMLCLVLLAAIYLLHDAMQFSTGQTYAATIFEYSVVAMALTSSLVGLLLLLLFNRPVRVEEEGQAEYGPDEDASTKSSEMFSIDEELMIEVVAEEAEE